jgi:hypothetical protein
MHRQRPHDQLLRVIRPEYKRARRSHYALVINLNVYRRATGYKGRSRQQNRRLPSSRRTQIAEEKILHPLIRFLASRMHRYSNRPLTHFADLFRIQRAQRLLYVQYAFECHL